jgi:hypothetical protein
MTPLHRRRVDFGPSRAFSIDKAQRRLGYAPPVDVEQGIARTAAWYARPAGCEQARGASARGLLQLVGPRSLDLPQLSRGQFWGDGATYYTMARSLAEDADLEYDPRDVYRVRREFPGGPQGIFLKRSSGGLRLDLDAGFPWLRRLREEERRIYFAKPFTYPVVAAPLVRLLGTRGLLVTNALALGLALVLGYVELRRRASPAGALALSATLFLATVTPVYLLWPAPELFYLALVAAGLFAWRHGRPTLSALLLGVATYSKPLWLASRWASDAAAGAGPPGIGRGSSNRGARGRAAVAPPSSASTRRSRVSGTIRVAAAQDVLRQLPGGCRSRADCRVS